MNQPRVFASILFVLACSAAGATTISVTTTSDETAVNGSCSLREALQAAATNTAVDTCPAGSSATGDVVALPAGTYNLTAGELLVSGHAVTLRGPATSPPTAQIGGSSLSRILRSTGGALLGLEDLRLVDGNATAGPGGTSGGCIVSDEASLHLNRVELEGCLASQGGGIAFSASVAQQLTLDRVSLTSCTALQSSAGSPATGGGLSATLSGQASIALRETAFVDDLCRVTVAGGSLSSASLQIVAFGASQISLQRLTLSGSQLQPFVDSQAAVVALDLLSFSSGDLLLEDIEISNSSVTAGGSGPSSVLSVVSSGGSTTLDRLDLHDNLPGASVLHASLVAQEPSSLRLTDSLFFNGPASGSRAEVIGNTTLRIGHTTIADQGSSGILLVDSLNVGGLVQLENSIVWGSATPVTTVGNAVVHPSTLTGIDPLFVDPPNGDYSLQAGSPAVDAGDDSLPTLRPYDQRHATRVNGAASDLGALERGSVFGDGFESGDVGAWTAAVP